MRRKLIVSGVLMLALLGSSGLVAYWLIRTAPEAPRVDVSQPPLVVRAVQLAPQTLVEPVIGFGTARADRLARLAAQVAGEVVAIPAGLDVGMAVQEGQVLVRIDDREYRSRLERAQSSLAAAEAQLDQLRVQQSNLDRVIETARRELASAEWEHKKVAALYKQGAAPKREFEQSRLVLERTRRTLQTLENQKALLPTKRSELEAMVRNRRAEVELARLQVERCTIRAPLTGRVAEKHVEVGERVQPGMVLLAVLDPDIVEVPVEIPVARRPDVMVGRACRLFIPGRSEVTWSGTVERIAPVADERTRTTRVFVRVDNRTQEHTLMPGVFVQAEIEGPTWAGVLTVPRGSVQEGRVFVYRDGRAEVREVHVACWLREQGIVMGLQPGDVVITSNLDALYDGAPVRLKDTVLAGAVSTRPSVAEGEQAVPVRGVGVGESNTQAVESK